LKIPAEILKTNSERGDKGPPGWEAISWGRVRERAAWEGNSLEDVGLKGT